MQQVLLDAAIFAPGTSMHSGGGAEGTILWAAAGACTKRERRANLNLIKQLGPGLIVDSTNSQVSRFVINEQPTFLPFWCALHHVKVYLLALLHHACCLLCCNT